ncbi:MAG: hypothetical protein EOM10_14105, partial [Opitutae bacterium]|nr:hypothetical protein [Opitutae bacterium]
MAASVSFGRDGKAGGRAAGRRTTAPAGAAETLTYLDLIGRLTDLEHLASLPESRESCAQWSSWDRRSRYDKASGTYIDWDANGDGQFDFEETMHRSLGM